MVTIYNENGIVKEGSSSEKRQFDFTRTLIISLSAALLLSLVGVYNLNRDITVLTADTVPTLQLDIAYHGPQIAKEAN